MGKIEKKEKVTPLAETGEAVAPESDSQSPQQGGDPATGENVDKIREILFGTQMRDYEKRFALIEERLFRELTGLKDETRVRLDSLEGYIKKEVESLIDRIKTEQNQRDESIKALLDEVKQLNKSSEKKISQLNDQLSGNSRDLRQQLLDQSKNLSSEIAHRSEELSASLEQTARELRAGKVSRSALSELLIEVALRLSDETATKLGIDIQDIRHE
jgi:multidrug efflux pump subunit AcrB